MRRLLDWIGRLFPIPPGSRSVRVPWRPRAESLEGRWTPSAGVREEYALELINRLRAAPSAEVNRILASHDPQVDAALSTFGVNVGTLAGQFSSALPAPALAWNDTLATTALAHSQAMLQAGQQSHQLPGEANPNSRIAATGLLTPPPNASWSYRTGENVDAYADSVFDADAGLAIDWGSTPTGIQEGTPHRQNLLDPEFQEVGIGLADAAPGQPIGPLLVTEDFAYRSWLGNPFVVGAVFHDFSQTGVYEPGEGLGGVKIILSGAGGTFQTTSTAAGGYQLQAAPGTYQLTATGGGLTAPLSQVITVGADNLWHDLTDSGASAVAERTRVPATPAPPAAPTFTGAADTTSRTPPTFRWSPVPGAVGYELVVDDLSTGRSQVIHQTGLTGTTYTPKAALPVGDYRVTVRAVDASGRTGAWSAPLPFVVAAPSYRLTAAGDLQIGGYGDWTTVDSGIASYAVDRNGTLWELDRGGNLWGWFGGQRYQLDGGVRSFAVAADGSLYDLENGGNLWMLRNNSWSLIDSNVRAFSVAGDGAMTELLDWGEIWTLRDGVWEYVASNAAALPTG